MELVLRPQLKQHLAYQALKDPLVDTVFLGGGAGGGKSWAICESRLSNAYQYPGYKSFIGREELKRLMQSTYLTWVKVCKWHNIDPSEWKLNGQYNFIEFRNGSRIDLLDLKYLPTDPLYERFGSLEYSDGAIEEAGEVNFLAYDVLKSRIGRHLNNELGIIPNLLVTGNPKKNWTYNEFYRPWKKGLLPPNIAFIQSLYRDNEYTAEAYGKQLSTIKNVVNRQRLKDGLWEYDEEAGVLINYDSILDIFTNTVELDREKYMTIDVARFGVDKTVIYLWRGLESYKQYIYAKKSIEWQKERIKQIASDEGIPFSHIVADEDGVGGGLVDGLEGIKGFIANSRALEVEDKVNTDFKVDAIQKTDVPNYKNLKAQCAYELARHINSHLLALKINLVTTEDVTPERFKEELIQEIEQIKEKDPDDDEKKLQIVSKDEVKEVIGRSPDYSDTLLMRMLFELRKQESEQSQLEQLARIQTNRNERAENELI